MKMTRNGKIVLLLTIMSLISAKTIACSIFFYQDTKTGKLYFVNNEDYFYDVKPYLQIIPSSKNEFGRIWYGWDGFGQGGINEKGLVLDGAVTPPENIPLGYTDPKNINITDAILANCANVEEAVQYLETKKIALKNAHIFFGDKNGNAILVEWVNGVKQIVEKKNNKLVATNFNISSTDQANITCWRYKRIQDGLEELDKRKSGDTISLKEIGNVMGRAVQMPQKDSTGKEGGTLYTTFIDLSEMKLILVYKLDNSNIYKLDILAELREGKKRKVKLE